MHMVSSRYIVWSDALHAGSSFQLLQSGVLHASQSVTFTVAVLPAEESALKTHGGITNGLLLDHANAVGTPLVTEVTPGAALTNVALFIDTSKAALTPLAEEKYWWYAPALAAPNPCGPAALRL